MQETGSVGCSLRIASGKSRKYSLSAPCSDFECATSKKSKVRTYSNWQSFTGEFGKRRCPFSPIKSNKTSITSFSPFSNFPILFKFE